MRNAVENMAATSVRLRQSYGYSYPVDMPEICWRAVDAAVSDEMTLWQRREAILDAMSEEFERHQQFIGFEDIAA